MTQPAGWYPDHDGSPRRRWWDGTAWTDDVLEYDAPVPHAEAEAAKRRSLRGNVASVAFIAAFVGLFNGFLLLGTLSAYGPATVEPATIESLDISSGSTTNSSREPTRWVEGTTESGRSWRFASDEIYRIARDEGYPMAVEVTISDWADVVVGVRGESFDVERRGLTDRVLWPAILLLVTGGAVLAAVLIRKQDRGVVLIVVLVVAFAIGTWLGMPIGRWVRS
ncbi:MAG: DUF2510 domain-containing protein [Acidimicrobiales bacterium]